MNPILGIVLIAIGSICAASFYVPFKKVKICAWESFLAGSLWFIQLHFYGMGRSQLPPEMAVYGFAWDLYVCNTEYELPL